MTNTAISNSNDANKGCWKEFIYARMMPFECDGFTREGDKVRCRVLANEKVQFKIKKVLELTSKKGNLGYKVVSSLRNYFSSDEPLNHVGAFYRIMAICNLSPASGRYTIKGLRVDGEVVNKKDGPLHEYLVSFMEDAINDSIYDDTISFEGKESLVRLPGIFAGCKVAAPMVKDVKAEFPGSSLFTISVDKSVKKYPLKKLKNGYAGIGTDSQLVSFKMEDLSKILDAEGIHTDRGSVEVTPLTEENLEDFKEKFCK